MSAPRAMVLRAPGINCERETHAAFSRAGAQPNYLHITELLAAPDRLDQFRILAYPDDTMSGRVLATEMRNRLGERMLRFVDRGGLAIGMCNGFQVLVRLGLLPCTQGRLEEEVTLTHNLSNHYECRWVTLQSQRSNCVFLEPGQTLRWPAAHGEGRLVPRDQTIAARLREQGHVALCYVETDGAITERYPANPNGSPGGVAGLCDRTGRVLGMMPHPDRAWLPTHMPDWRNRMLTAGSLPLDGDGMAVFRAMVRVAAAEG